MFSLMTGSPRVPILLISLAVFCSLAACSQPSANKSEPTPVLSGPPSTTFPMPPVSADGSKVELGWTLAGGERINLSQQLGKVLVLDFYATWCEPCRQSIPHLISLQQRYETKGLLVVGLNVGGPEDRIKVAGFAAEFHISYPLGFPDKSLTDFFLADDSSIPQTFVFNRRGQLIKRYIGYDESMPGQLESLIQAELFAEQK
jgi:cytochrome c biogenesis protein CcmG/thiol:disulfide interchange protein DsbE